MIISTRPTSVAGHLASHGGSLTLSCKSCRGTYICLPSQRQPETPRKPAYPSVPQRTPTFSADTKAPNRPRRARPMKPHAILADTSPLGELISSTYQYGPALLCATSKLQRDGLREDGAIGGFPAEIRSERCWCRPRYAPSDPSAKAAVSAFPALAPDQRPHTHLARITRYRSLCRRCCVTVTTPGPRPLQLLVSSVSPAPAVVLSK